MVCSLLRRPDYAAQTVEFVNAPTTLLEIGNAPPKAAIRLLRETIPADEEGKAKWRQQATIAAIMGSCPKSHESLLSGGQFKLKPSRAQPCFVTWQGSGVGCSSWKQLMGAKRSLSHRS